MRSSSFTRGSTHALFIAIGVIGLAAALMVTSELKGEPADALAALRQDVEAVAAPAFREWVRSQPEDELRRFGFASRSAANAARVLTAIPVITPRQDEGPISRIVVEASLDRMPSTWIVPISVDGRIVILVGVDAPRGEELKVVAYGKTFAANRLEAGIRALGSPPIKEWSNLRLVSFPVPTLDLLVLRSTSAMWTWWRLTGTEQGVAERLSVNEVQTTFDRIVVTDRGVQ